MSRTALRRWLLAAAAALLAGLSITGLVVGAGPFDIYLPHIESSGVATTATATGTATATPTHTPTATTTLTPTATTTLTPTAAPTQTPAACPLDDVSGTYDALTSNFQHNCPIELPTPPPSSVVEVAQEGSQLTFTTPLGQATGTIDPLSGAFEVIVAVPPGNPCIWGCVSTTSGVFQLGQYPLSYAGQGRVDIKNAFGGLLCRATYTVAGSRTACP